MMKLSLTWFVLRLVHTVHSSAVTACACQGSNPVVALLSLNVDIAARNRGVISRCCLRDHL